MPHENQKPKRRKNPHLGELSVLDSESVSDAGRRLNQALSQSLTSKFDRKEKREAEVREGITEPISSVKKLARSVNAPKLLEAHQNRRTGLVRRKGRSSNFMQNLGKMFTRAKRAFDGK